MSCAVRAERELPGAPGGPGGPGGPTMPLNSEAERKKEMNECLEHLTAFLCAIWARPFCPPPPHPQSPWQNCHPLHKRLTLLFVHLEVETGQTEEATIKRMISLEHLD